MAAFETLPKDGRAHALVPQAMPLSQRRSSRKGKLPERLHGTSGELMNNNDGMTARTKQMRVLILGGGFAGSDALRELDCLVRDAPHVEVIVVSGENDVRFTPMLHEVAASDVAPSDLAVPLHTLMRRAQFFCGEARNIDLEHKTVVVTRSAGDRVHNFRYDDLVLALGSVSNVHGLPGIAEHAITMLSLEDAMSLRNHMVQELERVECDVAEGHAPQLTLVVCGGGFAGVETVGAMMDFLQDATQYYPHPSRRMIRVILVHSDSALLKECAGGLGSYAADKLRKRGVEITSPHVQVLVKRPWVSASLEHSGATFARQERAAEEGGMS